MPTTSYIQAGTDLLAAALRDPSPIVDLATFWQFMKIVAKSEDLLTTLEKTGQSYQHHLACTLRLKELQGDIHPMDSEFFRLGDQLVEAMAAYAEQGYIHFGFPHGASPTEPNPSAPRTISVNHVRRRARSERDLSS